MNRRGSFANQEPVANRDGWGRWIWLALIVSILLHLLFWNWSRHFPIERMSEEFYDKIVPRTFQVERVEIDPRLLEPERDEAVKVRVSPVAVQLPEEKFSSEEVASEAPDAKNPPRLDTAILNEKPVLGDPVNQSAPISSSLPLAADAPLEDMLKELPALKSDPLASLPQPVAVAQAGKSLPTRPEDGRGFTNLDELLAQTGPVTSETAPILLPGDLLFEYDTYRLQPGAISSMQKLGQLLLRNPRSRFLIEGHSDSFGPDDYNLRLSELRARAVQEWLISSMGIPADSIETLGFGESRLVAPAAGSIEEQQINRRVEIVIRPPAP
jgi:outer membrane protein OmpA-like peptidoglycan-associated protein